MSIFSSLPLFSSSLINRSRQCVFFTEAHDAKTHSALAIRFIPDGQMIS